MENHDAYCEDTELRQSDAIKLVQEAIDQMLSPQSEDHSLDNPSSTGVITAEQELLGENQVEGRELSISASNSSAASVQELEKSEKTNPPQEIRQVVGKGEEIQPTGATILTLEA